MLPRSLVLLNIEAKKEGLDGYRISDQTAADEEQPDAGRTGQPLRINQGFPVAAGTESDLAFDRDAAGYRRSAGDDDYFVDEREDCTIHWIVPNAQKNEMEPILLELPPQGQSHEVAVHEGEEFGYVLSGRIKLVNLDTGKVYTVKKGQTFYVKGSFSHCLKNDSAQPARVLWICTPPIF